MADGRWPMADVVIAHQPLAISHWASAIVPSSKPGGALDSKSERAARVLAQELAGSKTVQLDPIDDAAGRLDGKHGGTRGADAHTLERDGRAAGGTLRLERD